MKLSKYLGSGIAFLLTLAVTSAVTVAQECQISRNGPFGAWAGQDCFTTDGTESPFPIEFVSQLRPPELPNLVPIDANIRLDAEYDSWVGLELKVKNTGSAPSGAYAWHAVVYASDGNMMWPVHEFTGTGGSLTAGEVTNPRIEDQEYTNTQLQPGYGLEMQWTVDATGYNSGGQIRELNESDNVWVDINGLLPGCIIVVESDGDWDCDM